mgnify:CR=1 FL=1
MDSKHKTVLGDAAPVKDIFANDMWKVNEPAKEEIEAVNERLKDPDLDRSERAALEESLRELNRVLSMFEAGDS